MTVVNFDPQRDIEGGTQSVSVTFEARVYHGYVPAARVDGSEIVFPTRIRGTYTEEFTVELETLPAEYYWRITLVAGSVKEERNVVFPGGAGPFDFGDMVVVDPSTSLPDPETSAAQALEDFVEQNRVATEAARDETETMLADTFVDADIVGPNLIFTTHDGGTVVVGPIEGSEGGEGTVISVNDVEPGVDGNVVLTPGDIGAQPAGSYATSSDLTTGLSGKANTSHTHTVSNVTGLQAALDGKVDDADIVDFVSDDDLADAIADINAAIAEKYTKPALGIPSTDFTSAVQSALGLATSSSQPGHSHAQSDVTGLTASLTAKADLVGGVVPTAQIPAIAISEFKGDKANQAAMLATSGEMGDWVIRTDQETTWIITGSDPTQLSSWTELGYPTASSAVSSVNTQTGTVVLGYADVGAAAATHTHAQSDVTGLTSALSAKADTSALTGYVPTTRTINSLDLSANRTLTQDNIGDGTTYKQYSQTEKTKLAGIATGATANQSDATTNAAIALKANAANPTFTGTVTVPDGALAIADTSGLQTALDGKAATSHTHTASQISDSTSTGRAVVMATDAAAARSAIAAAYTGDLDNVFTIASAAIPASEKGANLGVATLGADGKVPSGQLPPGSAPLNAAIGTVAPTELGEYLWIETDGSGGFLDIHVGEN